LGRVVSDTQELKQKRKLIEFITALSGFLGIVVAIISASHLLAAVFAMFLVILIVASVLAYSKLLSERKWSRFWKFGYELDIMLISLSFSFLLTFALASSLAQVLAASALNGNTGFVMYGIVVASFNAMFTVILFGELGVNEAKGTTGGNTNQGETKASKAPSPVPP